MRTRRPPLVRSPLSWLLLGLSLSCGGSDKASGPSLVVSTIQVTPGADTLVSLGDTRQLSAVPLDSRGDPVSGVTLAWTSSDPAVATVNGSSGLVSSVGNGSAVITARVGTVSGTASLLVSQEVASVSVTPSSASLTAINAPQQFTAVAKDANGSVVNGSKFLWLSSNQAVATVDTTGKATSHGPGSATVTAAARGIPGNAGLTVSQVATQLGFTLVPTTAVAGDPFTTAVEVEVQDAAGTLVAGARLPVTLAVPGDTLHGTTTVNSVGGIATFSGLWIDKAASHTLSATAPGLGAPVISSAVSVVPGPPSALVFVQPPQRSHAGDLLPAIVVRTLDRVGNTVPGSYPVTIALAQRPAAALLSGTTTVPASGGNATFSDLSVDSAGRNYALLATTSFASARSDSFVAAPVFASVGAGIEDGCGLTVAGQPFCWGFNFYSELGRGAGPESEPRPIPAAVTTAFATLGVGAYNVCGINVFGQTLCWGRDDGGQTGTGCVSTSGCLPDFVATFPALVSVSAGLAHSCGLDAGGGAICWGRNVQGSLGSGDTTTASFIQPVAVTGGLSFTALSVSRQERLALGGGFAHTCGLVSGGSAYCWGDNSFGEQGDGTADSTPHAAPVAVIGGHHFSAIAAGPTTCGLELNGGVYCWGWNGEGELGLGFADTLPHGTPTLVLGGHSYTQIAVGGTHACGLTGTGTAYCWGSNTWGQLGTGDQTASAVPVAVTGGLAFVAIAAGQSSSCGLTAAHNIWCWGANFEGEIGDGTTVTRLVPALVDP